VIITDKDGTEIVTETVDCEGNSSVDLKHVLIKSEEIKVSQKDKAGNPSPEAIVTAPDTTAPDAPTDLEVNNTEDADGNTTTTVTGRGEPGANVIITDKDGTEIGTGTVDGEGNFSVDLDQPLTNGEEIKVSQKDKAGNPSPEAIVTAPDTTSPGGEDGTDKPTVTIDEAADGMINKDELSDGIQVKVTLTDSTQVDDKVTIALTDSAGIEHTFEYIVTGVDLETGS